MRAFETDGGPAAPVYRSPVAEVQSRGLTIRDEFAKAIAPQIMAVNGAMGGFVLSDQWFQSVAITAYRFADAMMAARAAGKGQP